MNNVGLCFLITFLSGFSTMIGSLIIFNRFKDQNSIISSSLIFSSSIMLFLSLFDLIPGSFFFLSNYYGLILSFMLLAIYVLFGGILVYFIDFKYKNINSELYKIGIISMISLIIHNIPEGIITFVSSSKDLSIGIPFAISIALHNIPEGIAISIPIYYSEKKKWKVFLYTFIAAISEPFGGLLSFLFLKNINNYLFAFILSITAGIMIYLSIFKLLKESFNYNNKNKIFYFMLGILIIIISKFII